MLLILDIMTTAAILFVVAIGLLAIFGVLKIINFAHGAWLTIGAYCAVVTAQLGFNPWLALPLAFLVGGALGGLAELFIIRPLYRRPLDAILATWGLGIVIGQLITLGFGRDVQFTPNLLSGTVTVLGTDYSAYRLVALAAALVIGVAFAATMEGTRLGLSARAVIMNETLARGLGIDTARVRLITFMIGAGLAALAGVLLTPLTSVDPTMGVGWLIGAFMLVMVANGSLLALAIACLLFGAAQVLISTFVSPILGSIAIAILAALVLRVSPKGFARA
ncbi:branched-chain amino acid ABC transporter permease [Methylobacterium brachythecii]|uniref:Branched-chain amino acid ABC transporter permease n=1 Tax=Methylobacterium brachythecii TaxID=1176177 RepID=A0A7W6APD0_9HYPH|nr:branched-chain amino acid ABC transporter permease [Methylobacterium brachythecii]MBB3905514.1 branched-chain amino acid transport system permease protein [Methylobacterium brachythecii]GLS46826.1 branched-chain amino acid ABC transporter permease [Methylobacterium brachythecii]